MTNYIFHSSQSLFSLQEQATASIADKIALDLDSDQLLQSF
jgi:hypothetical protein